VDEEDISSSADLQRNKALFFAFLLLAVLQPYCGWILMKFCNTWDF